MRLLLTCLALCLVPLATAADTLEMRDGRVYEGTFKGGTADAVHFEVDGSLRSVPLREVLGVLFSAKDPSAAAPAAAAPPTAARVPAGTRLRVRLSDTLDPRSSVAGDTFSALLEMELQFEGRAVVPARSHVYGKVAEVKPTGQISLELTGLQIEGSLQSLVTGSQQLATAGGAAPAAPAPEGNRIPAGSLLEFRLLQPFDVPLR
jgi:hypothetical protein